MVSAYRELLELIGINEQSIRTERFMGYKYCIFKRRGLYKQL
jgi:hypothetical protein